MLVTDRLTLLPATVVLARAELADRQGYATEMVGSLTDWALVQPGVDRVVAETEWANPASARVLEKSGFISIGSATVQGGARFARY